jgi:hypothetical protein
LSLAAASTRNAFAPTPHGPFAREGDHAQHVGHPRHRLVRPVVIQESARDQTPATRAPTELITVTLTTVSSWRGHPESSGRASDRSGRARSPS